MNEHTEQAAAWVYRGVWRVLADLFRVPQGPPPPPTTGVVVATFRPATAFLSYLKFYFWFALVAIDLVIMGAWLGLAIAVPIAGALTLIPALVLAIAPDIVAYVAIHLRYDTTWYVLTDRSLRIRRGIWAIHETTVTYENIQNMTVRQGPVQRWFGIADVVVQTAGGGGGGHGKGGQEAATHLGLLEGLENAAAVRDLVLARLGKSRTAGLGDEAGHGHGRGWTPEHVEVLREIRDQARLLAG